jgi:hypothetical protein
MPQKKPERIIAQLRQVDVLLSQDRSVFRAARRNRHANDAIGVSGRRPFCFPPSAGTDRFSQWPNAEGEKGMDRAPDRLVEWPRHWKFV